MLRYCVQSTRQRQQQLASSLVPSKKCIHPRIMHYFWLEKKSPKNYYSTAISSSSLLFSLLLASSTCCAFVPRRTTRSLTTSTTTTAVMSSKKDQSFPTWSFDSPCLSMEWTPIAPVTMSVENDLADTADLVLVGIEPPAIDNDDDEEEEEKDPERLVLTGTAKTLNDDTLNGALDATLQEQIKTFKNGATVGAMTPTLRVVTSNTRYKLLGLGAAADAKDWSGASLGKAVAEACCAEAKVATCQVVLPVAVLGNSTVVQDFSTAFYQTLYADIRYRTGAKKKPAAEDLKQVILTPEEAVSVDETAIENGRLLAQGVFLTKDIVNAPHNVLNSLSLADTARRIAEEYSDTMTCTVLDKAACEERGMGAYLGVARGSETEPQFIHLTYKPKEGEVQRKVGIVGKGLLFDTGGYNIKTQMMELMKFDCGGSAAVLGAARAVAALQPTGVEAHFVVAACENMINEKAYVPSDVLTASNGKTIEIGNTDAEGRLTLADALVYVDKEVGCEKIIELSTLTGACMVSLGQQIAGVWSSNDDLAKELEEVSKISGDKSWRMPMAKEYNEQLESKIADIKNIGGRYGGAITAALFLENFVSRKKPFAHIDIAGPVWSEKIGATGFGAKLVVEWIKRQGLP